MSTTDTARLRRVVDEATPGEMYYGGRKAAEFAETFDRDLIAAMLGVIEVSERVAMFELPDGIQAQHDDALARFRQEAARNAEATRV